MHKGLSLALLLLSTFTTTAAQASLELQMSRILGPWRLRGEAVLKIQKQTDDSVKLYWCDENEYLNTGHCRYSFIKIYTYRANLDAFYAPQIKYCAESLQVSTQNPSDLMRVTDPYISGHCNDAGEVQEASRL